MALFYFTRKIPPNPFAGSWLVSGVITATTTEEAATALDSALAARGTTDRSSSFVFSAIDGVEEVAEAGLLAITMGGRG